MIGEYIHEYSLIEIIVCRLEMKLLKLFKINLFLINWLSRVKLLLKGERGIIIVFIINIWESELTISMIYITISRHIYRFLSIQSFNIEIKNSNKIK